ncbi:GGDEF domain-containing protein [Myceligenerans sp. TRM 65318]|uniref:GGDEF domain-containing protein n=2 Tax=Myceligenerans pegani TaxID=2776917 RepID=A0ABR9N157_9MICO|nr:GGDEF domain-containing protein [Myceligenerans sp. TRM 65318]MBE3019663.1 GGDEF domain-containing protein [Myceligenerans sp. TRM 65318]
MREAFTRVFTGRLGYGRAMLEHKPASMVTNWAPLVVEPGAHVAEVAARAMAREPAHRYDDVLVQDTRWGATSAATLMRSLLVALSDRSTHDPLTRLKTRGALWYALARRCEAARAGQGHFLLLFDVEGLHRVNASYGLATGDAVLVEVASRLVRALPQGSEAGRVGADSFAVTASLPVADDADAASSAEALRRRFAGALVQPPGHLPPGAWPAVRTVSTWSTGAVSAERLVLHAEARMRERRMESWRRGGGARSGDAA